MNLLKAALYDPSGAVSKATSALLAMTAFDTTNLRLAITVPAHGMVRFVLSCTIEGATTFPAILLGVLNGATVVGRISPMQVVGATALATTRVACRAEFTATGLTPGAMNVDAAYGVEIVVAATNVKYGGPNNTTTDDAWGGFVFEAWDPQPQTANSVLAVDANGRVDVIKVAGTTQTAGDLAALINTLDDFVDTEVGAIKTKTDFLPSATAGAAGGVFIAGTNAATAITTGLTTTFTGNLTGSVASVSGAVGSVTGLTAANLDATITSRMASYTQPTGFLAATFPTGTLANTTNVTAGTITTATNLTNAPTAGDFTATMKTSIGTAVTASAVASVTGNVGGNVNGSVGSVVGLTTANLDVAVSSRLATAGYTTAPSVVDILTTAITEAYRVNGAAPTLAQFISEVLAHLGEASISGTTKTINQLDHATPAETFALDSATDPSSITRAS